MPTLYDISQELAFLASTDEELTPEDEAKLAAVEMAFELKVQAILQYRQSIIADIDAIDQEQRRLRERADAAYRRAEWLRNYVMRSMKSIGIKRVSSQMFSAAITLTPPSVAIAEGTPIAEGFKRVPKQPDPEWDKKAILDAHRQKFALPEGVTIKQTEYLKVT